MNSPVTLRPNLNLKPSCDVAIIGAGPYGLSLAAQLNSKGIQCRIFGKPLTTWSEHMPKDMYLKSDGFASNLSAPSPDSTLKAYCAARTIPYAAQGLPIALDTFLGYANWFRKRYVHQLEEVNVSELKQGADGFDIVLEDGRSLSASNVVLAVGISWFKNIPEALARLPKDLVSHTYDHRDGDAFNGREVIVLGAGSSATDTASLLHDVGASVRIVARADAIEYNSVPDPDAESLLYRIQRPASGIGRGWSSYFCATAPVLFHKLPDILRKRAIQSHMHPAAGWFMREKIEGRIPTLLGRVVAGARTSNGRVELSLQDRNGGGETVACDHVIAATGYKPDMRKLPFLSHELCDRIAPKQSTAPLSDKFETRVPGLFVIGPAAIDSFGPLMRFMYGAEFAAPHVAAFLERRVQATGTRQAA
ncbi:MAG: NAD(P)-binding domain-containing protein [Rhizomicrobium sp.]|jgi:thioredoxin reductase